LHFAIKNSEIGISDFFLIFFLLARSDSQKNSRAREKPDTKPGALTLFFTGVREIETQYQSHVRLNSASF
jgi:hypothetical protein